MYVRSLLFLVLCLAGANSHLLNFEDCGSVKGKVIQVDFVPCGYLNIEFQMFETVQNATILMNQIVDGKPGPAPLPYIYACNQWDFYGLRCPLHTGKRYNFSLDLAQEEPEFHLKGRFTLKDLSDHIIFCSQFNFWFC
ncbi:NPC intracellular cholesterol transporter 2-like [Branchiostoma floridae x Branchiostoma belcheri]